MYVYMCLVIDIHLRKQPERQLAQPDNPQNICEGSQPHFQKMIDYNIFLCSKYKQVTPYWLLSADVPMLLLPIMH